MSQANVLPRTYTKAELVSHDATSANPMPRVYSLPELGCYVTGNIQYVPNHVAIDSPEYHAIIDDALARGREVRLMPDRPR